MAASCWYPILRLIDMEKRPSGRYKKIYEKVPKTPRQSLLESPDVAEKHKSELRRRELDLIINIPKDKREKELKNNYLIRRMAVDFDIPLITNIKIARQFVDAIAQYRARGLEIKAWEEYN
jgi:hypothetical protein